jgi:NAD(P)-dependent dehydrogenase (short-subunit alcohol dehydrogenase family)
VSAERELEGQVALVTGGGRGIGANIARELSRAGARVAVAARSRDQIDRVAGEIGGLAIEADVTDLTAVERMVEQTTGELGPIDLLCANAGAGNEPGPFWESDPAAWWHVFEVNVLGVYNCCRTVLPGMLERGRGRIVITGSGAGYLPRSTSTAYASSKAAVNRLAETLAGSLADTAVRVFLISPGLVKTEMTSGFSHNAQWTPPELAPRLVRVLASGRADALAGRYLHAEHDDIEDLIRRADEVVEDDLNAIRLRR